MTNWSIHPTISRLLRQQYDASALNELQNVFESAGTLRIPVLPSGLFAAAQTTAFSAETNYQSTWVRDTVHIAYAHYRNGQPRVAARAAEALCRFFATQTPRFQDIIRQPSLKEEPLRRPHIRFNGNSLTELAEQWSHAQNDALGYFLWLTCTLIDAGILEASEPIRTAIELFPRYFDAIEYWQDEDSGHWEEVRKISASSIGVVVAGLEALMKISPSPKINRLIRQGRNSLAQILPAECRQPDPLKRRDYDAALLFLIYPLGVVDDEVADTLIQRTVENLQGPMGIKRYLGDSFYCANYETLISSMGDSPTRDFSSDLASRNRLAKVDGEAEWCIFDSTLSTIYADRLLQKRLPEDRERQTKYFSRALCQLTRSNPPRCGDLQCPELYYEEQGRIQTSKAVPLLWAQANLWTAFGRLVQVACP